MDTQIGKIADIVQKTEKTQTPLQQKLKRLGVALGIIIGIIVVIVFIIGRIRGLNLFDMFFTSVSLAVGAIPE